MHELLVRASYPVASHLLYASFVWTVAWLLTSLGRGSATAKYWIWVATTLNFVLPLSALLGQLRARHLLRVTPLEVIRTAASSVSAAAPVIAVLLAVWALGAAVMLARLVVRIRADRRRAQGGVTAGFAHRVPVKFATSVEAPAVDGLLRPHISLPAGIDRLLTLRELDAVLVHELKHARRRDNLIRLIYEVSLCALWFHPLVWITGRRLALYRELSCDEAVTRRGGGDDLISALAKLADRGDALLLQATASSFINDRLALLTSASAQRTCRAANALLAAVFGAVLLSSVLGAAALDRDTSGCIPAEISELSLMEHAFGLH